MVVDTGRQNSPCCEFDPRTVQPTGLAPWWTVWYGGKDITPDHTINEALMEERLVLFMSTSCR